MRNISQKDLEVPVAWEKVEDQFIKGAWGNMSPTRIAKFLGRTRKAVIARAEMIGASS